MQNNSQVLSKRKSPQIDPSQKRLIAMAILVVFLHGFLASIATAQRGGIRIEVGSGELIDAPREARRLLQDAINGIEKQQWSEATYALGLLLGLDEKSGLSDDVEQDYFLEVRSDGTSSGSLRQKARELMTLLPPEGAKIAELRYGITARNLFDSAAERSDWAALSAVARDYAFTDAGIDAAWLVAEHEIAQGEIVVAAMRLDRLLQQSSARSKLGASIGVLAAACWKSAGRTQSAIQSLVRTQPFSDNGRVRWNGQLINVGKSPTEAEAAEATINIGLVKGQSKPRGQWAMPGGQLDRNGHSFSGLPLPFVRWDARLHESIQHEDLLANTIRTKSTAASSPIPTRIPLIQDPWAVVQTYDQRVIAVNLKTGKVDWQSVFGGLPLGATLTDSSPPDSRANDLLHRVWGEAATGQLIGDGQRLYGVTELPTMEAAEGLVLGGNPPFNRFGRQKQFNVLQCWSLPDEGKLKWEVGGESGLFEPKIAGAFFLGPPVRYLETLLIIAELNGEVFLMSLQPESGKLNWLQQLVANTSLPISQSPSLRELGCCPSVSGGIAVCPTLSGFLVAVDLTTQSLLWSYKYSTSRNAVQGLNAFLMRPDPTFDPLTARAVDNATLIADGTVFHLPNENSIRQGIFVATDLATGKLRWQMPVEAFPSLAGLRYIAGVWNQTVVLVGERGLVGLNARNGSPIWKSPVEFAPSERIAGRGVRNQDRYFVPLSTQDIIEVSIDEGRIVNRAHVEKPLGNLASTNDLLISMSPFDLTAYAVRDRLRSQFDTEILNNPESAWSLARKGEFLLAEGKIDQALDALLSASRMDPKNDEFQMLLMKTGIAALESDFAKFSPRIKEFEDLMKLGPEKTLYLTSLIRGFVEQGQVLPAFQRLLELSDYRLNQRDNSFRNADEFEPEPNQIVQHDRWIATQLQRLVELATDQQRESMQKLLQPRLDLADQSILPLRRRMMRHWMNLPGSEGARLKMAEELLQVDEKLAAESILNGLLECGNSTIQDKARSLLVTLNFQYGRATVAAKLLRQTKLPLEPILASNSSSPGTPSLTVQDLQLVDRTIDTWPRGIVEGSLVSRPNSLPGRLSVPCIVKNGRGQIFEGWNIALRDSNIQENVNVVLENPWGFESIEARLRVSSGQRSDFEPKVFLLGSLVFMELPQEIVAIDTLGTFKSPLDGLLWNRPIGRSPSISDRNSIIRPAYGGSPLWGEITPSGSRSFELISVSDSGVVYSSANEISCLDPLTGNRVWVRRGLSQPLHVAQHENRLVLFEPTLARRTVLDIRDGQKLDSKPWIKEDFEFVSTMGGNVLLERSTTNKPSKLRLINSLNGETLLEGEFPMPSSESQHATVASRCEDRFLVALQSDGKMTLWDLINGKAFTQTVEPDLMLKSIKLVRFGDALVVLPRNTSYTNDVLRLSIPSPDNVSYITVQGKMFALSATDGHLIWKSPVPVYDMAFPVQQSRQSPALTLLRQYRWLPVDAGKTTPRSQVSIAVLDVRNGEIAFANNQLPSNTGDPFSFTVEPRNNSITTRFGGQTLKVRWTNEPAPPAPNSTVGRISELELKANATTETEIESSIEDVFDPLNRRLLPQR